MLRSSTIGSSSWLQANISYLPVSNYDTLHLATSYGFSTSCPSAASVRSCFQTILSNMRAQHVSGIRIFVTFCDATSLAFSNCGQPYTSISWSPAVNLYQQTWINNLTAFFQDVQTAQIQNVTITLADAPHTLSQSIGSASSPLGSCSVSGKCCSDTPSVVYFSATQPYGLNPNNNYFPIGDRWTTGNNQGYNCSPVNPYFIGWNNEFNVINAMLAAAKGHVTIYEFENEQELNLVPFTAMARYIYDNSAPLSAGLPAGQVVNVLSHLRSLMTANGFDPGRVYWSTVEADATTATYNCTNVYTDWSRNFGLDEVSQAINAGYIGVNTDATVTNGLVCGGSNLSSMYVAPIYSTQPNIVDAHMYSSVSGIVNTDAQIQAAANTDFGDVPHFLTLASLGSANITIGETWGGTLSPALRGPGDYCWLGAYSTPSGAPNDNVAGFNSSSLSGYTVTFRPWMELEDPSGKCFAYGGGPGTVTNYQSVNFNSLGPYTPTNW